MIFLSPEDKKATTRTYFMRGLLFLVPIVITLWLVGFVLNLANDWLGAIVGGLARWFLPAAVTQVSAFGFFVSVASILLLCGMLVTIGKLASYRIGKEGLRLVDHLFIHIPGVNSVYRATRKMVEAFGDSGAGSFQRCVWLRFPASYYTLGFVTKETVDAESGRKMLVVFVPHCPNPTGGFTQVVPEDETKASDISPDEGLKVVLSMGVLTPDKLPKLY